jgi:hypothetical protein
MYGLIPDMDRAGAVVQTNLISIALRPGIVHDFREISPVNGICGLIDFSSAAQTLSSLGQ